MPKRRMDRRSAKALKEAIDKGRVEKIRREQEEFKSRCRATNFTPSGDHPAKIKQPFMLGEGLGNRLNFCDPKYAVWEPLQPEPTDREIEEARAEEERAREESKRARVEKARETRERNMRKKALLESRIDKGKELYGQRIFIVTKFKHSWEVRSRKYGGVPDGVDLRLTDFGLLLMVPVIEEDQAKLFGMEKKTGYRDREGRRYWVPLATKERVMKIFGGGVPWNSPLLMREVIDDFGAVLGREVIRNGKRIRSHAPWVYRLGR